MAPLSPPYYNINQVIWNYETYENVDLRPTTHPRPPGPPGPPTAHWAHCPAAAAARPAGGSKCQLIRYPSVQTKTGGWRFSCQRRSRSTSRRVAEVNTLQQSLRARARWHKAIRRILFLLWLRRVWAQTGTLLARHKPLFDHLERKKGMLSHKKRQ